MFDVVLFAEEEVSVDLENIIKNLNRICKFSRFSKGKSIIKFKEEYITHPDSYKNLNEKTLEEMKDKNLSIFITSKPYDNNFFFLTYGFSMILSFSNWNYYTNLHINNGIIYFIANIMSLYIDNSFMHNDITGCIYDFLGDKTGIDTGMRFSYICPRCLIRLSTEKLNKFQKELLSDFKNIANDLGSASKWNQDIVEYWDIHNKKIKVKSEIINLDKILIKNDFIPEMDDRNYIDIKRSKLDNLCKHYIVLSDPNLPLKEKGKTFEEFSKLFFALIKGWKLLESNARLEDCEIDLIYDISEGPPILSSRMGNNIYIECKNRNKKSDVKDISHFIMNLKSRGLKTGIFFSYKGITGYDPSKWRKIDAAYRRIIDVYRQDKISIVPIVSQDIEAIKNGANLANHILDLLNRFVRI